MLLYTKPDEFIFIDIIHTVTNSVDETNSLVHIMGPKMHKDPQKVLFVHFIIIS